MEAAAEGDEAAFRSYIAAGENVDELDRDGCTALMLAAALGNTVLVESCLREVAKISYREYGRGRDALTLATEGGHLEVMSRLRDVLSLTLPLSLTLTLTSTRIRS